MLRLVVCKRLREFVDRDDDDLATPGAKISDADVGSVNQYEGRNPGLLPIRRSHSHISPGRFAPSQKRREESAVVDSNYAPVAADVFVCYRMSDHL